MSNPTQQIFRLCSAITIDGNTCNFNNVPISGIPTATADTAPVSFLQMNQALNTLNSKITTLSSTPVVTSIITYLSSLSNTTVITGTTQVNSLLFTTNINGVSPSIFNYIANLNSDAQYQLNSLSSQISTIKAKVGL